MSAGHASGLFVPGDGPLYRMAPECKIAAGVLVVLVFAVTPREAFWALGIDGALVALLAILAGLPLRVLGRRLALEAPFVVFALLLPLLGRSPRTDFAGLSLSVPGLWGAWNILAKATLGFGVMTVLAATTATGDLLRGLERLRVPRVFTTVGVFMVRYAGVVAGEARRMRSARAARGERARWIWQARGTAATVGTLFVRAYERGERVHLAMASRGFTGSMPESRVAAPPGKQWAAALALPAAAAALAVLAGPAQGLR